MWRVLAKPADNQVVAFGCGCALHHFKVEINTRTHTHRQGHVTETSYQATLDALARTYARTLFRDMGPVLTTAKPTWHWSEPERSKKSKVDPREGWGFCVCGVSHFITRETYNRPRKTFEAMGGVCGNRLCGYLWCQLQYSDFRLFPELGLCLSAERQTRPRIVYRSRGANHSSPPQNVETEKYLHQCRSLCDFEAPLQFLITSSMFNVLNMMF